MLPWIVDESGSLTCKMQRWWSVLQACIISLNSLTMQCYWRHGCLGEVEACTLDSLLFAFLDRLRFYVPVLPYFSNLNSNACETFQLNAIIYLILGVLFLLLEESKRLSFLSHSRSFEDDDHYTNSLKHTHPWSLERRDNGGLQSQLQVWLHFVLPLIALGLV